MAYYGRYDYTKEGLASYRESGDRGKTDPTFAFHHNSYTGIMVSDDAGETWHGPVGITENYVDETSQTTGCS